VGHPAYNYKNLKEKEKYFQIIGVSKNWISVILKIAVNTN